MQAVQPRIKHGMVLPFCPVTLTFQNIHYFVDLPAVSGNQQPEIVYQVDVRSAQERWIPASVC